MNEVVRALGSSLQVLVAGLSLVAGGLAQDSDIAVGSGCAGISAQELSSYRVDQLRFDAAFDFLGSFQDQLEALGPSLPQQQGALYVDGDVLESTRRIRDTLGSGPDAIGLPVAITVVLAVIENCRGDQAPQTLELTYQVFSSHIPFLSGRTVEDKDQEYQDPAGSAGVGDTNRFLPVLGYEAAGKLMAGGNFVSRGLAPFDALTLGGRAGPDSKSARASLEDALAFQHSWFSGLKWKVFHRYEDSPSPSGKLRRNRGGGQVELLMGRQNPTLRSGVGIETGSTGSLLSSSTLPVNVSAGTRQTSVKGFVGLSNRARRHALSTSYGLQLASVGDRFGTGFRKHLADVRYTTSLFPARHRPLRIDARLNGGWIENLGTVPVTERFFGGSVDRNFLEGTDWWLRDQPVLRSVSQNSLATGSEIGGTRFLSANLTVSPTVWGVPLVPNELEAGRELLEGQLTSARSTLSVYYETIDPAMRQALAMTDEVDALSEAVRQAVRIINGTDLDTAGELEDRLLDCMEYAISASDSIDNINSPGAGTYLSSLVEPQGSIDMIIGCAHDLEPLVGDLTSLISMLETRQLVFRPLVQNVDSEAADRRAADDMAFIENVVGTLFDEINLTSVAPVIAFDATRMSASDIPSVRPEWRYGIGGGLQLGFVGTIYFTIGYSFDVNRPAGAPRGAVFVSTDFMNLFY